MAGRERQEILTRADPPPPRFSVVLSEAALRRPVGGYDVMLRQLEYLMLPRDRANVTVQVLSFDAGVHPAMVGPFTMMTFPDPDDLGLVNVENATGALFLEETAELRAYDEIWGALQASALSPDDSQTFLRSTSHQIAQRLAPDSRVVYIDRDPIVVRHQKVNALAENQNTAFILSDARDVERILDSPDTRRLIDFGKPAAVLYFMFLHFVPDESDPRGMVRGMMDRLAPGSYLVVSHVVSDEARVRQQMTEVSLANTRGNFGRIRSREEVRAFFDGLEPVEPGLVDIRDWRPDDRGEEQADRWFMFGGVAHKPA